MGATLPAAMRPPPEDPDALFRLGQLEYEAGRLESAANAFYRAIELQDLESQGPAVFGLGRVRLRQGDRGGAYAAWRLAIATRDPEYAPRAACFMAMKVITQVGARLHQGARESWEEGLRAAG